MNRSVLGSPKVWINPVTDKPPQPQPLSCETDRLWRSCSFLKLTRKIGWTSPVSTRWSTNSLWRGVSTKLIAQLEFPKWRHGSVHSVSWMRCRFSFLFWWATPKRLFVWLTAYSRLYILDRSLRRIFIFGVPSSVSKWEFLIKTHSCRAVTNGVAVAALFARGGEKLKGFKFTWQAVSKKKWERENFLTGVHIKHACVTMYDDDDDADQCQSGMYKIWEGGNEFDVKRKTCSMK